MGREIENTWVKMQRVGESMESLALSSKPSSPVRGGKQVQKQRGLQIWCLEVGGLSGGFSLFLVKRENDSDGRTW